MSGRMTPSEELDASGLSFAIVWARFNDRVTERLLEGARKAFAEHGAEEPYELDVPGAFELPWACKVLLAPPADRSAEVARGVGRMFGAGRGKLTSVDGVVALGCVIRGDTPHFDFVAGECARGLMDVQIATRVPIAFGVLTTDTEEQALARAGGAKGNKGYDAALVAIEMARLSRELGTVWAG